MEFAANASCFGRWGISSPETGTLHGAGAQFSAQRRENFWYASDARHKLILIALAAERLWTNMPASSR